MINNSKNEQETKSENKYEIKSDDSVKDKPISILFVFFIVASLIALAGYMFSPSEEYKKSGKTKSMKERLEYRKDNLTGETRKDFIFSNNAESPYSLTDNIVPPDYIPTEMNMPSKKFDSAVKTVNPADLKSVLEELKDFKISSTADAQVVVNKFLALRNYPENIVKVVICDSPAVTGRVQGSSNIGHFDVSSGNIYIEKSAIEKQNPKILIAVAAHELDHFDKINKICKFLGIEKFESLLNENSVPADKEFWSKASQYADIKDFDSDKWTSAFKRLIGKNDIDKTSSYFDFYKIAEQIRNPMEISGYAVSDEIEKYYGFNKTDGPLHKITKAFNAADWAVYNVTINTPQLSKERIAVFDYFYMKAVIKKYPETKEIAEKCLRNNNGNLSDFWVAYESKIPGFYKKGGQIDTQTLNTLIELLKITEDEAKKGIKPEEAATALINKTVLLFNNLAYPKAVSDLTRTAEDYITYIQANNISSPENELKAILILICAENELYKTNQNSKINLYDIKIPESLKMLYPTNRRKQKYSFIYTNEAFKKGYAAAKESDSSVTDTKYLTGLLNSYRLDIKK